MVLFLFRWSRPEMLYRINTARDQSLTRHSFKPPFQGSSIPYWEMQGAAVINNEIDNKDSVQLITLAPKEPSQSGSIWNQQQTNMKDWEAMLKFKISGSQESGGDGIAFWFTQKNGLLGPVYGNNDFWTGLGIFFDTYNNDGLDVTPLISAHLNDGTTSYNFERDGIENALGTCTFQIRNTGIPILAKIRYVNRVLAIQISLKRDYIGLPIFQHCLEVQSVDLAPEGFFGLSSQTGSIPDQHVIYSFSVKDLSPINTNIKALMKIWEKSQEILHQQHNDLTESEFKHTVLQQLRQIQDEVNMIELSTIADTKEVQYILKTCTLLETLLRNIFQQWSLKMPDGSTVSDLKVPDLANDINLESNIQKITGLLNHVRQTRTNVGNRMAGQIKQLTELIESVTKDMNFFKKHVVNTHVQFNSILEKLESQNPNIENLNISSKTNSNGFWTYFIIAIITAPLGGILAHFCKPKSNKWPNKYNSWDD